MDDLQWWLEFWKTPVLTIIGLYVVSRKVRLYLLRDVLSRKLLELNESKRKIARACESAMGELEGRDAFSSCAVVDESDIEAVTDVFKELKFLGLQSTQDVATITYLSDYVYSNITHDLVSGVSADKSFVRGMAKGTLYSSSYNALSLIHAYTSRSLDFPEHLNVSYQRKPLVQKLFFQGGDIRFVRGLERGASSDPYGQTGAEFFYNVIGVRKSLGEMYLNSSYFRCIGTNKVLYFYLFKRQVWFPLKLHLVHSNMPDGARLVHLVAIEESTNILASDGEQPVSFSLTYQNLNLRHRFVDAFNRENKLDAFRAAAGYESNNVNEYQKTESFTIKVSLDMARSLYPRKVAFMSWDMNNRSAARRVIIMLYFYAVWVSRKVGFHKAMGWESSP